MSEQHGSLTNMIYASTNPTIPEVGIGATQLMWTDRNPFTVIEVSKSGKRCKVQADKYTRVDNLGMSESQEYTYESNPDGIIYELSLRKDGKWKDVGGDQVYRIGQRERYYDFSF